MRTVFTEKKNEDSFTHDGCLVVDFLDLNEVDNIRQGIKELGYGVDSDTKLRITINQESAEKKNEVFERFFPVFQKAADKFLNNYKLMRIGIFDKLPGGGYIRIHQHPHIIDETKYRSVTTWVPINDTTLEMGTLHIVKGSHKVFVHKIRTHNDYKAFGGVSTKVIKKYSTPILLKAGQAVIFDDRTIHWSPPNKSSMIRTAFQLEFIPQEANDDMAIYYRENKRELSKYKLDAKTYRECALTLKKPDNLSFIKTVKQPYITYNNRQFISMMRGLYPDNSYRKENFLTRVFNIMD